MKSAVPTFTVLVACYNCEKTLDATIETFLTQKHPLDDIEFIFINDGSTDSTLSLLEQKTARLPLYKIISHENIGIAGTRQVGLDNASGKWITSIDPDDLINDTYFSDVYTSLELDIEESIHIISTRVLIASEETGTYSTSHPLDGKFRKGNRVAFLLDEPNGFAIGATTFLRSEIIQSSHLTYDTRISPTFEDGNFIAKYLLNIDDPIILFSSTSHYYYRKSSQQNSAVQSGWQKPEKYYDQILFGYLSLLQYASDTHNHIPLWLQYTIFYDITNYLVENRKHNNKTSWLSDEQNITTYNLLSKTLEFIDIDVIFNIKVNNPGWIGSRVAAFGLKQNSVNSVLYKWGSSKSLTSYSLITDKPFDHFLFFHNGTAITPALNNSIKHTYFGQTAAYEHTFTAPSKTLNGYHNNEYVSVINGRAKTENKRNTTHEFDLSELSTLVASTTYYKTKAQKRYTRITIGSLLTGQSRTLYSFNLLLRKSSRFLQRTRNNLFTRIFTLLRESENSKTKYKDSWLFLDRPDSADDNAEHLYRYVQKTKPHVNSYFILSKSSNDWQRLKDEGFKLINYNSLSRMVAASYAKRVISSDAIEACLNLLPKILRKYQQYKFVFLQHGVSEKDISGWLRNKPIDLCITTVPGEHAYFTTKDSPYHFSTNNAILAGQARHDSLVQLNNSKPPRDANSKFTILIAPTWRKYLQDYDPNSPSNYLDNLGVQKLSETPFVSNWRELMRNLSHTLPNVNIVLLPHPNLNTEIVNELTFPNIDVLDYTSSNFQNILTDADIVVTDYSSVGTEAALLHKTVIYYQFDIHDFQYNIHTWKPGFFDFESMGFGPVFYTPEDLSTHVFSLVSDQFLMLDPLYKDRIESFFPFNRSENSLRNYIAINEIGSHIDYHSFLHRKQIS